MSSLLDLSEHVRVKVEELLPVLARHHDLRLGVLERVHQLHLFVVDALALQVARVVQFSTRLNLVSIAAVRCDFKLSLSRFDDERRFVVGLLLHLNLVGFRIGKDLLGFGDGALLGEGTLVFSVDDSN